MARLILLALAAVLTASTAAAWTTGRSMLQREKPSYTCIGPDIVLFHGGRGADNLPYSSNFADTWAYNATSRQWTELFTFGAVPRLRASGMAYCQGKLFAYGGVAGTNYAEADSRVYTTNPFDKIPVWSVVKVDQQTIPGPRIRGQVVGFAEDAFAIMFGLYVTALYNDVWVFNTTTSKWSNPVPQGSTTANGGPVPSARYNPVCNFVTERQSIVCFAGTMQEEDSNQIWSLDVNTWSWTLLADEQVGPNVPTGRRVPQTAVYQDKVWVYGGYSSGAGSCLDEVVYRFDLKTNMWEDPGANVDPRPIARCCGLMLSCSSSMKPFFAFGEDEIDVYNDAWEYSPETNTFTELQTNVVLPPPRGRHTMVTVGAKIFSFFGSMEDGSLVNNVWSYDTTNGLWLNEGGACPFGGRTSASSAAFGPYAVIFGGKSSGALSNDVLVYDTIGKTWTKVTTATGTIPSPRALAAVGAVGDLMLVFGGTTSDSKVSGDLFAFDVRMQHWTTPRASTGAMPPARRAASLAVNGLTGTATLEGGDAGLYYLMDRWTISVTADGQTVTFANKTSILPPGDRVGKYVRSMAVAGASGSKVLIASGVISDRMAPLPNETFIMWDSETGANDIGAPIPVSVYEGAGVYFGRCMYLFGGFFLSDMKTPMPVNTMQTICFDDQTTFPCSIGTTAQGGKCVPTTSGSYSVTGVSTLTPCSPGTASVTPAAVNRFVCEPCPAGFYNPASGASACKPCPKGQTCPMGSTSPDSDAASRRAPGVVSQQPPPQQPPKSVSPANYMIVVFGAVMLLVAAAIFQNYRYRRYFLDYYTDRKFRSRCRRVFRRHTGSSSHMEFETFVATLRSNFAPTQDFSKEAVRTALGVFRRKSGIGALTCEKFVEAVAVMIGSGLLEPVGNTDYNSGKAYSGPLVLFSLRSFDAFASSHVEPLGNHVTRRRTTIGGCFSMALVMFLLLWAVLLGVQFHTTAGEMRRWAIPRIVVDDLPVANLKVGAQYTVQHAADCTDSYGACPAAINASYDSSAFQGTPASSPTCNLRGKTCTVTWECADCALVKANTTVTITSSAASAFTSHAAASVSSNSGIEGFDSVSTQYWQVSDPATVYRGTPGTTITATLVATQTRHRTSLLGNTPNPTTGYHVSINEKERIDGNVVTAKEFSLHLGLAINVILTVDPMMLVIEPTAKQSTLDLLTALLGGMAGLVLIVSVFMTSFEAALVALRQSRAEKRIDAGNDGGKDTMASLLTGSDNESEEARNGNVEMTAADVHNKDGQVALQKLENAKETTAIQKMRRVLK